MNDARYIPFASEELGEVPPDPLASRRALRGDTQIDKRFGYTARKLDWSAIWNYGRKKRKAPGKYVGFNRRMLAATIDSILLLVFLPLINWLAPINAAALGSYAAAQDDPKALLLRMLTNREYMQSWMSNFMMQMLFWCVFSAVFLHLWAATPGKMLLRMKVVDAKTEGRITATQALLRSFGYLVSGLCFGLGFLWIGLNKRHRGWHDYLGDTVVISLPLLPWQAAPPSPSEPHA